MVWKIRLFASIFPLQARTGDEPFLMILYLVSVVKNADHGYAIIIASGAELE